MSYWVSLRSFSPRNTGAFTLRRLLPRLLPAGMLALAIAVPSASALSPVNGLVTVQMRQLTPHLNAYAQVQPTSTLPVNVAETGIIRSLKVVPGMRVRAGQVLAILSGPGIHNLLLQDRANLRSARTQLDNAQKTLAIQQEQLHAHLSTRQMVHQAQSALAKAADADHNAQAQLAAVQKMRTVTAPVPGIVLALNSHDGELLQTGQPVLTLQSNGSLWLIATYYGGQLQAIHAGMTGQFAPAGGSPAIPVKVAAMLGVMTPGGGESVALRPLHDNPAWLNGESGSVTLNGQPQMLPTVPTRALVLDHGKWWVLVHTAKGNHAVQVVPGPAKGWNTFIESGLKPGMQVVTANAYLLFHSQITKQYQMPD